VIKIENKDIKTILDYPVKQIVLDLLESVNLKATERYAIDIVDIKGYSEEKASIAMNVSRRSIQTYRRNAYNKMKIAFSENDIVKNILEDYE